MCGRFTLTLSPEELKKALNVKTVPDDYRPRYNIAPTQSLMVVSSYPEIQLETMKWGLVPSWADDPAIGNRMINARAETVSSKPAFRRAFKDRRCLILADGFYEWQRPEGKKGPSTPYYFQTEDRELFAFAGLYEFWRAKDGDNLDPLLSCTIITTAANEKVQPVHDRMPVILPRERWADWMAESGPERLQELLQPLPAAEMTAYPVSKTVNSPAVDTPDCIQPWGGA